tara:strand:- start:858 stop:1097 length:240 start_codon:yes stop_codon:yes gene_type:complete
MNKETYTYEVSEQSTDTRYFEIVSNRKLTEEEIHDAVCLTNISKEGDCVKEGGITATFKWTDFGEDSDMEIDSGEVNDE